MVIPHATNNNTNNNKYNHSSCIHEFNLTPCFSTQLFSGANIE